MLTESEIPQKSGVYEIVNLINGKRYIGQAVNLERRFQQHLSGCSSIKKQLHYKHHHLRNSYQKYGGDNFIFRIIKVIECDDVQVLKQTLIDEEQTLIDSYPFDMLYNTAPTAGSTLGFRWGESERFDKLRQMQSEKASRQIKEQWKDDDFRQMHSEKMSEQNKELWQNEDFRQMKSDEMSEKSKELWQDEDFRQMHSEKMSEQNKEQWQNEDFRQMRSEKIKEQWQDEDFRQMQSEKAKKQWDTPEKKAKMSAAIKAGMAKRKAEKENGIR